MRMNFLTTNPFELLGTSVSPILLQSFVVLMIALIIIGTLVDIIHKKNVKYFFENAKKAKKAATRELGSGERAAIVAKTVVYDIGTTSELGAGKRRVAHLLGMYVTILFWIASVVMIFLYSSPISDANCMANIMACWCNHDSFRWMLVLVFS